MPKTKRLSAEQAREHRKATNRKKPRETRAEDVPDEVVHKTCNPDLKQLCKTLDDRTHAMQNEHRAGFHVVVTMKLTPSKPDMYQEFWRGVAYRTKASDKGVFLNFCPFCGEALITETSRHGVPIPKEAYEPPA